jgi:4-hydroxyphenylpyruvate dioxygenase
VRTSIATVSIAGSLREKITAIARAGFDGLEIFENDFVASSLTPAAFRHVLADNGLTLDLYQPFRDFEGVSAKQYKLNLERARHKFNLMGELGVDTILLCSNVATVESDDHLIFVDQLGGLANLANEFGVKVAYEALAWGRHVSTYDVAWKLVKEVDHPNLGICLDSFHILSRGTSLNLIDEIPGEKIFFVQLADAPLLSLDVLSWSRHHRLFPGEGGWDIPNFVARVLRAGYRGPISLEIFNDVYRQGSPSATARDGRRSLTYLEDQVVREDQVFAIDGLALAQLPVLQEPNRVQFVEFAPGEGSELESLLAGLGFSKMGKHVRKNATLWANGHANVVVNSGAVTAEPELIAFALEYNSRSQAMARMRGLQYEVQPRDRIGEEADFGVVKAPNGMSILVGEVTGSGKDWTAEFNTTTEIHGTVPTLSGINGIDHIALSEPAARSSETTLFLRSALGLELEPELDLPSEYGLVRSRSANNVSRSVRLALNVNPELMNSRLGVSHVAFSSADIFQSARTANANRLNVLKVPANYYEDLGARLGLDGKFVAELMEFNILFDRDENGTFLHFYTVQVGRFFAEVLQRLGTYDGYGAYNSFVRLASQRSQEVSRAQKSN